MKTRQTFFLFLLGLPHFPADLHASVKPLPLAAPEKPVEERYCDTTIVDPYRSLERLDDKEVRTWFRAHAEYAKSVIEKIPGRNDLIRRMIDFDSRKSVTVYNLSITESNRYFYLKRTPSDETGKLYYRDGFEGSETLLFDPSGFESGKGKKFVISNISPTDDGKKVAVSVAANGSEDDIVLVMHVETGNFYGEKIDRCRFAAPSWLPDGSAFLYNRLADLEKNDPDIQKNSKVYLHKVGTDPSSDREVFSNVTNPELGIRPEDIPFVHYDKDSGYLYATVQNVDPRITAYYAPVGDLYKPVVSWMPLLEQADNVHDFSVTERELYLYSPEKAPNFRVLRTSLERPDIRNADVVIREPSDGVLTSFGLTNEGIYYTLSKNGVEEEFYRKPLAGGKARNIRLPFAAGSVRLSTRGFKHPDVWVVISGWTSDYKRYRYNASSPEGFSDETLSSPADYPEYEDLMAEELLVTSHDGTKVPLSLVYRKGTKRNGAAPMLFYGYGAYGNALTPFFSPHFLLWTYKGGILAIAHVRGGGELGDAWHKAGMKTTKPNTWKDLIACAEYATRKKYSSPGRMAANSASAGGILVGKAMTERPGLFAAVIPQVGAMNPLRGEETPNGPVNAPEFGTVKDSAECRALIAMDPYLAIRKGISYPAALVTAGMNDPRVIAWQPAKFAARLAASTASEKPVLFLTDFESGHGIGDMKTKRFETLADVLSFAFWQTGHPEFQPE
ncbi:peptidase S9 [Prosthecochloris sp. GSB1]|uniref:prolyl oligopeptidase family serine peptidase n=1 Tax=Prosthecochloris sp. GSB1 TaxID=281093 RepID=UPI000B8CC92F|nr:prolyl oligopeptidase family serine peptidase [Prosthecochloris sp. GSB1]ASQ90231.1 peptidase S9 [Prosthecochloris sp. GSB1]